MNSQSVPDNVGFDIAAGISPFEKAKSISYTAMMRSFAVNEFIFRSAQ